MLPPTFHRRARAIVVATVAVPALIAWAGAAPAAQGPRAVSGSRSAVA